MIREAAGPQCTGWAAAGNPGKLTLQLQPKGRGDTQERESEGSVRRVAFGAGNCPRPVQAVS